MNADLHILHLEDTPDDAELIAALLEGQEIHCEIELVETREGFIAALERGGFDLILSDYSLPTFDGLSALQLARELRAEVPFIFVSGTLGEETAIEALKRGAMDYVFKHRLLRLGPAVRRAITQAEERLALKNAETAMIQSEFKYRQLFECLSEAALLADWKTGRVIDTNRQAEILLGRPRAEILGVNVEHLLTPATLETYLRNFENPDTSANRIIFEGEILNRDGPAIPVAISAAPILLYGRQLVLGLFRDVTERKKADAEIQHLKAQLACYRQNPEIQNSAR